MAEHMEKLLNETKKKDSKPDNDLKIVGYHSVDGDRNFIPDSSQLRYYNPPKETVVHLDLNEGIECAVQKNLNFEDEGIDLLLEWLKLNHKKLRVNPSLGRLLQPKFICTRGTLTRFLTTGSMQNQNWSFYAAKWKGNIYLCAGKRHREPYTENPQNNKLSSWGFKFEQYVLSASPNQLPDTSKPVVEPAEFRCIYQRRIGDHSVLFSAIRKGLCSKTPLKDPLPLDKLKFIDTKTNKIIKNDGQEMWFRKNKFNLWWAQCYLTDTQEVLCGFRDENGIVQKLRRYNIKELVNLSKLYWNPETRIDFCQSVLTKISDTVVNECDETVYKFQNIPHECIKITELPPGKPYGLIPESFMEALG